MELFSVKGCLFVIRAVVNESVFSVWKVQVIVCLMAVSLFCDDSLRLPEERL